MENNVNYSSTLLNTLNPEQKEVVTHGSGPLLV